MSWFLDSPAEVDAAYQRALDQGLTMTMTLSNRRTGNRSRSQQQETEAHQALVRKWDPYSCRLHLPPAPVIPLLDVYTTVDCYAAGFHDDVIVN